MDSGRVQIYYGDGHGKSMAALGCAVREANEGGTVFIIQFLKGRLAMEPEFMKRLEPEIKIFYFEKSQECYEELSEKEKLEENMNLKNGVNFARKVLLTGECSMLVLDEMLGVIDNGVISREDVESLLGARTDDTKLILTGRTLPDYLKKYADGIYKIVTVQP